MEDGLRDAARSALKNGDVDVLILVLMEDGLRVPKKKLTMLLISLNPCFNGRWSARSSASSKYSEFPQGLNPCFNGRWSASSRTTIF